MRRPLPFLRDAESLARSAIWNLCRRHGDFDVCVEPASIAGSYDELVHAAHTMAIEVDRDTVSVRGADLADIVRSKETADRFKGCEDLAVLVRQLEADETRLQRRTGIVSLGPEPPGRGSAGDTASGFVSAVGDVP